MTQRAPGASDPLLTTCVISTVVILAIIVTPLLVTVVTAFNSTTQTVFPPEGWSTRWFSNAFRQQELVTGFWLSCALACASSLIAITFGTLSALALTRGTFWGREALDSVIMSPLIVPQVILGVSFLVFYVRVVSWTQFINLLLVHSLLTLPYATRVVRASLARVNIKLEEAAVGLGATRLESFVRITVPQIRSGLFVAVFFSFVVSFDNFTATAFLSSKGATLPVEIYFYIESRLDPTISAIAALMMLATTIFVLVADRMVGVNRIT